MISDGEDHQGKAAEVAKAASEEGIVIYTIGVGSEGGAPIPISKKAVRLPIKRIKREIW